MGDGKDHITPASAAFGHLLLKNPDAPPPKNARKKRRRKGQLNDGQWAPGYDPGARKKTGPVNEYYDPNDGWRPPRRNPERRQSTLSIALEALGCGLVIAVVLVLIKAALGA